MKDSKVLKGLDFEAEYKCDFRPEGLNKDKCGGDGTHLLACTLCGSSEYRCETHEKSFREYVAARTDKMFICHYCHGQATAEKLLRLHRLPWLAEEKGTN